uniref:Uncharacterized protein n=1 Tax=Alexandrium monilatum TaxID=311494 RepID=A0A7S4Q630_9DINO
MGGTTFEMDPASRRICAWRSYCDGGRSHRDVSAPMDFGDLDPSLSVWQPRAGHEKPSRADSTYRAVVSELLQREAALWAQAELDRPLLRTCFEDVYSEDTKLINPWTVELSRDSRWEGLCNFAKEYTDCQVDIHKVVVDAWHPGLLAVERTFTCTNRESRVRGSDEDWVLGEIVLETAAAGALRAVRARLRYCRVYFETATSCQDPSKSTGARLGWDMPHVVNVGGALDAQRRWSS